MKKNVLSLALAIAVSLGASASPIDGSKAAKIASRFANGKVAMFANTNAKMTSQNNEVLPYYVFNIGDNEGFVVVAGDDSVNPILAYSHTGSFKTDDMPVNLKSLMNHYAESITAIQKMNKPARIKMAAENTSREAIKPLLKSKWNQDAPFNNNCPDFGNGKCYAGCVPVAMSQMMNYHQWPAYEVSKIDSYTFEDYTDYPTVVERTVDGLPAITFDWKGAAIETIGNADFDKAVADICRYAGQSVFASYGTVETSAYSPEMIWALANRFSYNKGMMLVYHNDFKDEELWKDIIYNELKANRPVIIEGNEKAGYGHEFVCHGYENGKFYINWGWGGYCDGYFDLDNLDPEGTGIGGQNGANYSYDYGIIINAEPNAHSFFVYSDRMTVAPGKVQTLNLKFNCDKNEYTSLQFDLALPKGVTILEDGEGKIKAALNTSSDHKMEYSILDNGDYHFVITSATNSVLKMTDASLMNLEIAIAGDAVINSATPIVTRNGVVKNSMNREFDFYAYDIALKLEDEALLGDANDDGTVDKTDAEDLRRAVLNGDFSSIKLEYADMDKDGVLDIADFMLIKDKLLRNEGRNTYFVPTVNEGLVFMSDIKNGAEPGDKIEYFFPTLANAPAAKALQFNIKIKNGASLKNVWSDPSFRTSGSKLNISYNNIGDNTYRVMIYDNNFKNITDHFYVICGMGVDYKADLATEYSDIVLFTTDGRKVAVSKNGTIHSGIDKVSNDHRVADSSIYTLQGVKVGSDANALPKGVYIVNGKKVVIK